MKNDNSPCVPWDVIFDILKWCDYATLMSFRMVSRECHEMTKQREIWELLVQAYVPPSDTETQPVRILELPLSSYATLELEYLVRRWEKAERAWISTSNGTVPLRPTKQFKLTAPGFNTWHHDESLAFLAPGGRWFIEFGVDASARYYDLDADALEPATLILPPTGTFLSETSMFLPSVFNSGQTFAFHVGVCFRESAHDRWTITIWRISRTTVRSKAALQAERVVSFHFNYPAGRLMYLEAMDLNEEHLAVYTSVRSPTDNDFARAVSVVRWTHLDDHAADFERYILCVPSGFMAIKLLPRHSLLAYSAHTISLLEYGGAPCYRRTLSISEILDGVRTFCHRELRTHVDAEHDPIISRPRMSNSSKQHSNDAPFKLLFEQTLLIDASMPYRLTAMLSGPKDGHPGISIDVTLSPLPHTHTFNTDGVNLSRLADERCKFCSASTLLELDEVEQVIHLFTVKRSVVVERCLLMTGSFPLQLHPRREKLKRWQGSIHSVDEGIARVVLYSSRENMMYVVDLSA